MPDTTTAAELARVQAINRMRDYLDLMEASAGDAGLILAYSAFVSMDLQEINGVQNLARAVEGASK